MLLADSQVAFYRENGYLILEDVLTPDQVDEGRRIVEAFTERSRSAVSSPS